MQTANASRHLAEIGRIRRDRDRNARFMGTLARAGMIDETINDAAVDVFLRTECDLDLHYDMLEHLLHAE